MSRTLVVCYSRSGVTNRVALHLADALGAEIERIEDVWTRGGVAGFVVSAFEAVAKGLPTICATRDPRDYDLVVLGTPVWAGTFASPVRSYVARHAGALRRSAFFAVMDGHGGADVVRELQIACGTGPSPTCVLTRREVTNDAYRVKCDRFVRQLTSDGVEPFLPRVGVA